MRKSTATEIVARRLGVARGRADSLVQRAAEDNLLPTADGSRRYPPDLGPAEMANLLLAVAVDKGLAVTGHTVRELAGLTAATGPTLGDALTGLFRDGAALQASVTGSLVIRLEPASASMTLGGTHMRYGPEPPPDSAGRHVIIPGRTLAAIGLEFGGRSPAEAETIIALVSVSRARDMSSAFSNPEVA